MNPTVQEQNTDKTFKVKTQGLHHAAYLTKDMDATVKFYNELLDMPLVVTLALPSPDPFNGLIPVRGDVAGTRHYFFDCGNGASLAFFSWNETFGDMRPARFPFSKTPRSSSSSIAKRRSRSGVSFSGRSWNLK